MEVEIRYLFAEEATYTAYIPVEAARDITPCLLDSLHTKARSDMLAEPKKEEWA